jgi:site-specific DNA-methyltransferase (adenine-specific)
MESNSLYLGDNLAVMRGMQDGAADLIYLDPPFASQQEYGIFLHSGGEIAQAGDATAFSDIWRWRAGELEALGESLPVRIGSLLCAIAEMRGSDPLSAYLVMMAPRLVELRRLLAPDGSLYLHCDPNASHYLKALLDAVFGADCFRREIVWRSGWVSGFKSHARNWVRNHDVILYYVRDARSFTFNTEERFKPHPKGYERRGGGGNPLGTAIDDVWEDPDLYSPWIMSFSTEKRGYATQKPVKLLDRIVRVSSRPGDHLLDPFCGGGTALVAAQALGRRWTGIDSSPAAISVTRARLAEAGIFAPDYDYRE